MRNCLVLAIGLSLISLGCLGSGKWHREQARPSPAALLLQSEDTKTQGQIEMATRVPEIPVRQKFRFCCAFGQDMGVRLGQMPVPFLKVGKVLQADEIGPHRYDGATAAIDDERPNAFPGGEANGMMYTCHAGWLDTAHIREQVDWAAFFASQLDRHMETGVEVDLTPEGARRRLVLQPVPTALVEEYGRDDVIVAVSQWLAYQGSVWHEIAQWYGWSLLNLYPETVSGFSPEDPISNVIGLKLLSGANVQEVLESEHQYNHSVDQLIQIALQELGPVSSETAKQVMEQVDSTWWDSTARLPDRHLVRRRYLDTDTELEAWLIPDSLVSNELQEDLDQECGPDPEPAVFRIPDSLGGIAFSDFATLEITPIGNPAQQPIFELIGTPITQEDFPRIMEDVRAQNEEAFGPRAHLPN